MTGGIIDELFFKKLKWNSQGFCERYVVVLDKDERNREVTLLDANIGVTFIADVPSYINMNSIRRKKAYRAKFYVLTANISNELRRDLENLANKDPRVMNILKLIDRTGGVIYRFLLVGTNPIH